MMKITTFTPTRDYPYLAVWAGEGTILSEEQISKISNNDVLIISMVEIESGADLKTYVQPLLGGKAGYVTTHEKEYFPLPKGWSITLEQ